MDRLQEVGAYLRYQKLLEPRLFEMTVLMVARHLDQAFEWAHHHPIALSSGLDPDVVTAIGEGRRPGTRDRHVQALWALVDEGQRTGGAGDATSAAAAQLSGGPCRV